MKKIIFIILITFIFSGCANKPFNPPEFNKYVIAEIEINDNIGYDKHGRKIVGLSIMNKGLGKMKLPTIKDLYDTYNMYIWGHELMHFVFGTFHSDDEASTC